MDQSQVAAPPKGRLWGRATQALPQPPPPLAVPSCGSQLMPPYFQFFQKPCFLPEPYPENSTEIKAKEPRSKLLLLAKSPHSPLMGSRLASHHSRAQSFPAGLMQGCSVCHLGVVEGVGDDGSTFSATCVSFPRLLLPDHLPEWPRVSGGWRLSLESEHRYQAESSVEEALGPQVDTAGPEPELSPLNLWCVCM